MNVVVLTASEPLYLPAFFQRFLAAKREQVKAIFVTPPLYGKDSTWKMLAKYRSAFGIINVGRLARRVVTGKLRDALGLGGADGCCHSVARVARRHGLPCETVANVNGEAFLERLRLMGTDLVVSVSCPQIFRRPLIELPTKGCLNLHGALLPRYRGIAPSFWMMAEGESRAGVTVFFVTEDIDAGDVVEVEEFPILPDESLHAFIVRSKQIACDALIRAIDRIEAGDVETTPLDKTAGSYFGFPTREAYDRFRRRGRRLW